MNSQRPLRTRVITCQNPSALLLLLISRSTVFSIKIIRPLNMIFDYLVNVKNRHVATVEWGQIVLLIRTISHRENADSSHFYFFLNLCSVNKRHVAFLVRRSGHHIQKTQTNLYVRIIALCI